MSKIQQVHGEQMMQVHEELDRALKELDIVKQRLGDSRARTCELSGEVARAREQLATELLAREQLQRQVRYLATCHHAFSFVINYSQDCNVRVILKDELLFTDTLTSFQSSND